MSIVVTNKDKSQALIVTVGFHILVILIFILIKYKIPAQVQVEEYGMEVNLGNSEDGFGDEQPEDPNDPSSQMASLAGGNNSNNSEESKDVYTDDHADEHQVAVRKPVVKPKTATQLKNEEPKKQTAKPTNSNNTTTNNNTTRSSRFNVAGNLNNSNGNNAQNTREGRSQGQTQGDGDQGRTGGSATSNNYTGSGGSGTTQINHSFRNRSIRVPPSNKAEFSKGGSVKVDVRVDREGNVTVIGTSGTTDPALNALARSKASQVKFTKAGANDPIEQKGTIVFNFKIGK